MGKYYLAVDIGASSGRHILFWMEGERLRMQEIYRFENSMTERDGRLLWDTERLFSEIIAGMKECRALNMQPSSMSIDTWGVDYVLLDGDGKVIGDTYAYRDHRTDGIEPEVYSIISENELYRRTGIQYASFNTIYQLTADRLYRPEALSGARTFLMLPDYFLYKLTGVAASEYTNATTTQLVNPATGQWDRELITMLGLPREIFLPLNMPGYRLGKLLPEIAAEVGFDCEVIECASHDTASAVMAMPCETEDAVYISSGTWSLMGTELPEASCGDESRRCNFTNEGGYNRRFRYLKNIMGLWMIQQVRHEAGDELEFSKYAALAFANDGFPSKVDANDPRFLSPTNMTNEIRAECLESGQPVPESAGELAAVIYKSLAACYGRTIEELEETTGRTYDTIHIIGGGCKNGYLNQLTADATGRTVYAGPSEATAIGNALAQIIADGEIPDLASARRIVRESFEISEYR